MYEKQTELIISAIVLGVGVLIVVGGGVLLLRKLRRSSLLREEKGKDKAKQLQQVYIRRQGQVYGPYTSSTLKMDSVLPTDYVGESQNGPWIPSEAFDGFGGFSGQMPQQGVQQQPKPQILEQIGPVAYKCFVGSAVCFLLVFVFFIAAVLQTKADDMPPFLIAGFLMIIISGSLAVMGKIKAKKPNEID